MKHPLRLLRIVAAISAGLIAGSGCRPSDTSSRTLRILQNQPLKTLDPASARNRRSYPLLQARFETLYQYGFDDPTFTPIPGLAAELPVIAEDGRTLKIPLRTDVRFHGLGRGLTADDVIYTLKRLADPSLASPGWWLFEGKIVGLNRFRELLVRASPSEREALYRKPIEGLRALTPHLLEIRLARAYPQFLHALVSVHSAPVPHEAVPDGFRHGETGPFILIDWHPGREFILERNPEFHAEFVPDRAGAYGALKPTPLLDRAVVSFVASEPEAWKTLQSGGGDTFGGTVHYTRSSADALIAQGLQVSMSQQGPSFFLLANLRKGPLTDLRLRQGLSSAIDRRQWIRIANPDFGIPQTTLLPPALASSSPSKTAPYDYDLVRARKLIGATKAGKRKLRLIVNGSDSMSQNLSEFLRESFEKVGVDLQIGFDGSEDYDSRLKAGDFDLALFGWSFDYPDSRSLLRLFYGENRAPNGPNYSGFQNAAYDRLYEKAVLIADESKRAAVVKELERILYAECPFLFGYHHTTIYAAQKRVRNFKPNEFLLNYLKYLSLDARTSN